MKDYIPFITRLPRFFEKRPASILSNDKAISFEAYTEIPALNASVLKQATPAEMLYSMTEDDEEEAEALTIGRLVHLATLEPDSFHTKIAVIPSDAPKKPTKAQINAKKPKIETLQLIQWWEHFRNTAAGKEIIDADTLDKVEQMRDALFAHHKIKELLNCPGHTEASIEVWNPELQVMQKARFDKLPGAGANFLMDVKTTRKNLDMWSLKGEIRSRGYHLQARYYADTLNLASNDQRKVFYFPFVRNVAPYIARLVEINEHTPGENLMLSARDLLYANNVDPANPLPIGRVPMFVNAAQEFLLRVREIHPKPFGAWEGYENEGAQLIL